MSPALEQELLAKYPAIYPEMPMNGGFQVGDGWYPLVSEVSARLEALTLSLTPDSRFSVDEVKAKFGCLRITFCVPDWGNIPEDISEKMTRITSEARERSKTISEGNG